jgi:hypothetical protein
VIEIDEANPLLSNVHATIRPLEFPEAAGFMDSLQALAAPAGPAKIMTVLMASAAAVSPTNNPRQRMR